MKKGDEKLSKILEYITDYIDEFGYSPSVREIQSQFDIKSTSTVSYYLDKLRSMGAIEQTGNKFRTISVGKRCEQNVVPLVGSVSAGMGILAVENIEGQYPLPKEIFKDSNLFMLRVEGNSMINVGICNGDLVVVHKQETVDVNEIAVVFWQDVATVKRIVSTTPNLVLHPENDEMQDIVIPPLDNPMILGKVVGCIKKF